MSNNDDATTWAKGLRQWAEERAKTNPMVDVFSDESVVVHLTLDQLHLLETIMDVVRDDDDDTNPCIPFAEMLHQHIFQAIEDHLAKGGQS
jgi:hypothetical protein